MSYALAMNTKHNNDKPIKIEEVWPGQTPEWYAEAEENVRRYLSVIIRISERLKAEGKGWPK
jgi:hypothetical protein